MYVFLARFVEQQLFVLRQELSYVIYLTNNALPKSDGEALEQIESQQRQGVPLETHGELFQDVSAKFPCIMDTDDDGIWADGPLADNFKTDVIVLAISSDFVEDSIERLAEIANQRGYTLLDPQEVRVYRPT